MIHTDAQRAVSLSEALKKLRGLAVGGVEGGGGTEQPRGDPDSLRTEQPSDPF